MQTETPAPSLHALVEMMHQGDVVLAMNEIKVTHLYGHRDRLRQIVWAIQDVVWPGWYYHTTGFHSGRSMVLKYADDCDNPGGTIVVTNRNYKDKAWDQVLRILAAQGVIVIDNNPALRDAFQASYAVKFQERCDAPATVEGLTEKPNEV